MDITRSDFMMGIQLQLILTTYFISSGWALDQSRNPTVDQVVSSNGDDEVRIQGNFQNLLNSIAKDNTKKSEVYHEILKRETAKGQQTFNTMRDELWAAQIRNTNKKRTLYKRSNTAEDNTVVTQEVDKQEPVTSVQSSDKLPQSSEKSTELPQSSDGQPTESFERVKQSEVLSEPSENSSKITGTSGQSTEPTKPTSPKPPAETCIEMKNAILSYDMKSLVNVINVAYKRLFRHPQTNQISLDVLNHLLVSCRTHTKIKEVIIRPDPKSNYTQAAGTLDIRSVDQKGGNIVIKIKFNQNPCLSIRQLLNCVDEKSFKELYPGEKVTLLSLNFNKDREGPVIRDWMALFIKDGEIIGRGQHGQQPDQTTCLKTDEYKDLKYRDKLVVEYFDNLN